MPGVIDFLLACACRLGAVRSFLWINALPKKSEVHAELEAIFGRVFELRRLSHLVAILAMKSPTPMSEVAAFIVITNRSQSFRAGA